MDHANWHGCRHIRFTHPDGRDHHLPLGEYSFHHIRSFWSKRCAVNIGEYNATIMEEHVLQVNDRSIK